MTDLNDDPIGSRDIGEVAEVGEVPRQVANLLFAKHQHSIPISFVIRLRTNFQSITNGQAINRFMRTGNAANPAHKEARFSNSVRPKSRLRK